MTCLSALFNHLDKNDDQELLNPVQEQATSSLDTPAMENNEKNAKFTKNWGEYGRCDPILICFFYGDGMVNKEAVSSEQNAGPSVLSSQ